LLSQKLTVVEMLKKFVLPINGLKIGEHKFQWKVGGEFFKEFDNDELQNGDVHVSLVLRKKSNLMELSFIANGFVISLCDRCAGDLNLYLDHKELRVVKFSATEQIDTDDFIVLGKDDYEIDVSHMVYETIVLGFPTRRVHSKNSNNQKCDADVLNRLELFDVKHNNNNDDSRWSALNQLLTDKNK
jgi:uncharacterized metal-binding protein YceD (DUF177 family)